MLDLFHVVRHSSARLAGLTVGYKVGHGAAMPNVIPPVRTVRSAVLTREAPSALAVQMMKCTMSSDFPNASGLLSLSPFLSICCHARAGGFHVGSLCARSSFSSFFNESFVCSWKLAARIIALSSNGARCNA